MSSMWTTLMLVSFECILHDRMIYMPPFSTYSSGLHQTLGLSMIIRRCGGCGGQLFFPGSSAVHEQSRQTYAGAMRPRHLKPRETPKPKLGWVPTCQRISRSEPLPKASSCHLLRKCAYCFYDQSSSTEGWFSNSTTFPCSSSSHSE